MSTAYNVAQFLDDNSIGEFAGTSGWSINVASEPSKPDRCITVYDTGGEGGDTDQLDPRPTFQVRARGTDYLETYNKQKAIEDLLLLSVSLVMGGVEYIAVFQTSEIAALGRDDSNRYLLVANYRAILER